ncbi:DUF2569 domain-containing protein [Paenibacillus ihuae]|uniref:DUF2569 domain-containing protein n=1 Tax=Paenibacillus ihuae TaxID=1232431 RepID=UPI0006D56703|nr:DUF2569 domain-containing protein [Paenibacillus ihuae]
MGKLIPGQQGMRLSPDHPKGLGGWLVLIQIGLYLTLISTVLTIFQFFNSTFGSETWDMLTTPGGVDYHNLWRPTLLFEVIANIVIVLLAAYLLILLYNKKSVFPRWLIFFYLGNLLVLIVDAVLLSNIPSSDDWVSGNRVQDIARTMLTCLIWITYVLRSKRVRNTFVE